ncbi:phage gp6-like head-tail connector protein [Yinghuangia sp. YIM S09857]|uniref:phage gp6-like head-tail connector protein n=1 Tax=Yinghuangia sp. YIM S09857 TaxID=3436929 RepID=UPI003F530D3B
MAALATVADIAVRLGRPLADEEAARVQALLDDVSALIRGHCGIDFGEHLDQAVKLTSRVGIALDLPSSMRPLHGVSRVLVDGEEVTDWWADGLALYRRRGWRRDGQQVDVTASWGYRETPADVTAICAAEAMRLIALSPGVYSERVGDLEVTYAGGGATGELSAQVRRSLTRYRPRMASVAVQRT